MKKTIFKLSELKRFDLLNLDELDECELVPVEKEVIDLTQSEEESVDKLFSDDSTETYESLIDKDFEESLVKIEEVQPVEKKEEDYDYHMVNAVDIMAEPFEFMNFERRKKKKHAKKKACHKDKRQRKRKQL